MVCLLPLYASQHLSIHACAMEQNGDRLHKHPDDYVATEGLIVHNYERNRMNPRLAYMPTPQLSTWHISQSWKTAKINIAQLNQLYSPLGLMF